MKNEKQTQVLRIWNHLKSGKPITPLQALKKFGCFRLSARIFDIRYVDPSVKTRMIKVGKNKMVAQYYI